MYDFTLFFISTVQENIHFLAAVMAVRTVMLRQSPDHLGTIMQAPLQNLIANCRKQDRINRAGESSPSLPAASQRRDETPSRPNLSWQPITAVLALLFRQRVLETQAAHAMLNKMKGGY